MQTVKAGLKFNFQFSCKNLLIWTHCSGHSAVLSILQTCSQFEQCFVWLPGPMLPVGAIASQRGLICIKAPNPIGNIRVHGLMGPPPILGGAKTLQMLPDADSLRINPLLCQGCETFWVVEQQTKEHVAIVKAGPSSVKLQVIDGQFCKHRHQPRVQCPLQGPMGGQPTIVLKYATFVGKHVKVLHFQSFLFLSN